MLWNIRSEFAEERRRSMEFRTVEAKGHAAVLVELKHVGRECEAESIMSLANDKVRAKAVIIQLQHLSQGCTSRT